MKAIGRLYQYFEFKDIKPTRFERDLGFSNGYFSIQMRREADIGSSILEKITENCRDLNLDWLISGKGNMIKEILQDIPGESIKSKPISLDADPDVCEKCIIKDKLIDSLESQVEMQAKFIRHLEGNKPTV